MTLNYIRLLASLLFRIVEINKDRWANGSPFCLSKFQIQFNFMYSFSKTFIYPFTYEAEKILKTDVYD